MARLIIVTYHYVRDLPNTPFPRIKGLMTGDFRRQMDFLISRYEMASSDSMLAFLDGSYRPRRDLCYLTFDDGLKDHYTNVLPVLVDRGITGGFFPITACLEESWVATAHKNHFLMAALDFGDLYQRFVRMVEEVAPDISLEADADQVRQVNRWDEPEVAIYKYYVNYALPIAVREHVLNLLFAEVFSDERGFADELYLNWSEIEDMRRLGMAIGAHSHRHHSFSSLSSEEQRDDLQTCYDILLKRAPGLEAPSFCYPYGNSASFPQQTPNLVKEIGFGAAVTSISDWNNPGADPYLLRRVDTRQVECF